MLQDLVLRRVGHLVDRAEERGGFVPRHVVRYLDRFGHCGDPTLGFAAVEVRLRLGEGGAVSLSRLRAVSTCGGRAMASEPGAARRTPDRPRGPARDRSPVGAEYALAEAVPVRAAS